MFAFKADGGTAAVTGNYFDIIGESQNFGFDRIYQCFVIAAGEVGAADGTAENGIAGDKDFSFAVIKEKAAAPHGVSGKIQNFSAGQGRKVGGWRQIFCRRKVGEKAVVRTIIHCRIGGSNFNVFHIESACHFAAGGNVVNVGVSEQNPRLFKGETFTGGDYLIGISAGVDDKKQFFRFKKYECTVGGNGADRKSFYSEHCYFFLSSRITWRKAGVLSSLFNLKSLEY